MVKANAGGINDVVVSLDTHQKLHIAHSLFWVNKVQRGGAKGDEHKATLAPIDAPASRCPLPLVMQEGAHPAPFTPIDAAAVESGEWMTTEPKWRTWGLKYVKTLETNKRFVLLIWPEVRWPPAHC